MDQVNLSFPTNPSRHMMLRFKAFVNMTINFAMLIIQVNFFLFFPHWEFDVNLKFIVNKIECIFSHLLHCLILLLHHTGNLMLSVLIQLFG